MPAQDDELTADALDRRAALAAAAGLGIPTMPHVLTAAAQAYGWLRQRETLRPTSIEIVPGTPRKEGSPPMAIPFSLADTDEVTFSLTATDAKGAPVGALPAGFTAAWSLADPDSTGAVLTPSADGSTAVLSAGVPDSSLMVSVAVTITNPDGSTSVLNGAEAVIVTAGPATGVAIVPGTPTPEQ